MDAASPSSIDHANAAAAIAASDATKATLETNVRRRRVRRAARPSVSHHGSRRRRDTVGIGILQIAPSVAERAPLVESDLRVATG